MKDDSDRAKAGKLPETPDADAKVIPTSELDKTAPLIDAFAEEAAEALGKRIRGLEPSIPTPYAELTERLAGGFREGFYVLVGATKTGKTQMAVEMAVTAAQAGHPVLYASLEIARKYIYARMISVLDGKPWSWLTREAENEDREAENLHRLWKSNEAKRLRRLPIRVFDDKWPGETTLQTAKLMKEIHPDKKAPFIVVDYLQRVSRETGKAEDIRTAIGQVTETAARAAKETGASVLLVSSTARANYDRLAGRDDNFDIGKADATELLGTGKESGDIEFDAHATLVLCTKPHGENNRQHYIAVAGSRDGPGGWAGPFIFHNGARFVDANESEKDLYGGE